MLEKLEFTLLMLHNKTTSINNNYKTNSLLRMNCFLLATTKITFKTFHQFEPLYKLVRSRGTGVRTQWLFIFIIFLFWHAGKWMKTQIIWRLYAQCGSYNCILCKLCSSFTLVSQLDSFTTMSPCKFWPLKHEWRSSLPQKQRWDRD